MESSVSMHSPRGAAQNLISINTETGTSNYNLVCNHCASTPKFSHFDEFMEHRQSEHGPNLRRSAISIMPEENTFVSARGSISHLSTRSGVSSTLSPSSANLSHQLSRQHSSTVFDLKSLRRPCLLEFVQLLNKCFCIWHRPTRETVPRGERLHAYQLLLQKLREHIPFVTFRDTRSIVRQLIRNYFRQTRGCSCDGAGDGDTVSRKSVVRDDDCELVEDNVSVGSSRRQVQAIKSKVVLDKLCFLNGADDKEVEELVPDKHCAFCNLGFHNTETMWTHMVSAHLPVRKQSRSASATHESAIEGATTNESAIDTLSLGRRRARSRSRSRSRSSVRFPLEHETEETTEDPFPPIVNYLPLRRSRRRRRSNWRNCRGRGKKRATSLKRLRRRRRLTYEQQQAVTQGEHKVSSTIYMGEYSDKFLEDFIALFKQHECLWLRNAKVYRNRKLKEAAYDALVKQYCRSRNVPTVSVNKIKNLIRRLRGYYERLRQPNANPFRNHIWQRLAFLDSARSHSPRSADTAGADGGGANSDFDCSLCPRRFKRFKSFTSHMFKMHPPTGCPPCKESFKNADELRHHLLFIHRKESECPLCCDTQNDWQTPAHLTKHFYEHHCPTCPQIFHDLATFQRHKVKCRNTNRFRCTHCSLKFTSTLDFRRHAKLLHQDERPFKCDDCEITFKYLAPLAKHRRLHKRLMHYYAL